MRPILERHVLTAQSDTDSPANNLGSSQFDHDLNSQFVIQLLTNTDYLFLSIWAPVNPRRGRHN